MIYSIQLTVPAYPGINTYTARACAGAMTDLSGTQYVHRRGAAVELPGGRPSVWRHTCVSAQKVPCTAAAAGMVLRGPLSCHAAVDQVARTPPAYRISGYYTETTRAGGRIRLFLDKYQTCWRGVHASRATRMGGVHSAIMLPAAAAAALSCGVHVALHTPAFSQHRQALLCSLSACRGGHNLLSLSSSAAP